MRVIDNSPTKGRGSMKPVPCPCQSRRKSPPGMPLGSTTFINITNCSMTSTGPRAPARIWVRRSADGHWQDWRPSRARRPRPTANQVISLFADMDALCQSKSKPDSRALSPCLTWATEADSALQTGPALTASRAAIARRRWVRIDPAERGLAWDEEVSDSGEDRREMLQ